MEGLKHLQEFPNVEFQGTIAKSYTDDNGVKQKYYRSFFTVNGKEFSVKNDEPLGGLTGTVMFVKKDEKGPDGKPVNADAFTLKNVRGIEEITREIERKRLSILSLSLG